jgi:hypothetical protein
MLTVLLRGIPHARQFALNISLGRVSAPRP